MLRCPLLRLVLMCRDHSYSGSCSCALNLMRRLDLARLLLHTHPGSYAGRPTHLCLEVWCGVVWCGVVWCGVVWCGVVWCGVVWCGVVWCCVSITISHWNPFEGCRRHRPTWQPWLDRRSLDPSPLWWCLAHTSNSHCFLCRAVNSCFLTLPDGSAEAALTQPHFVKLLFNGSEK
jgi:hypothetical protein